MSVADTTVVEDVEEATTSIKKTKATRGKVITSPSTYKDDTTTVPECSQPETITLCYRYYNHTNTIRGSYLTDGLLVFAVRDILLTLGYVGHTVNSHYNRVLKNADSTTIYEKTIQTKRGLQKTKCISLDGVRQLVEKNSRLASLASAQHFMQWLTDTCEEYAKQDAGKVFAATKQKLAEAEEEQFFGGLFPIYQTAGSNKLLRQAGVNLISNPEVLQSLIDAGHSQSIPYLLPAIDLLFHFAIETNYKAYREAQGLIKQGCISHSDTSEYALTVRNLAERRFLFNESDVNLNAVADAVCAGRPTRDKKEVAG